MDLKEFIWYEKHRPKKLKDLVLPKNTRNLFKEYIKEKQIPHLLFHGPYGSGKTTVAQILMDKIPSVCLELGGSASDRGIKTIKEDVANFAKSQAPKGKIKIVFFDEADGITADAQKALKNTIEKHHKNTRFIFTANAIDRMDGAIFSRCTVFHFEKYSKKELVETLKGVLKKEDVLFDKKDLMKLVKEVYPDVRSIMNNLQMGSSSGRFKLSQTLGFGLDMGKVLTCLKQGDVRGLRALWGGLSSYIWVYRYLFDKYIFEVKDKDRPEAAQIIAEYLYKDSIVADREINATACCIELIVLAGRKVRF